MTTNPTPTIAAMTQRLVSISSAVGCEPKEVTLTAVSSASMMLGLRDGYRPMLAAMAQHPEPAEMVRRQWQWWQEAYPYLRGHLDPIIGWMAHADLHGRERVLAMQLEYLSELDLPAVADRPGVAGDLLGQVLCELNASGDRSARGAFYTPPALAMLMAQVGGVLDSRPNESIHEPCVGGGGLVVAAVRALRAAGKAPELRRWVLQDIDPMAVAICGVAMSIHGMVDVQLMCTNALDPVVLPA